MRFYKLNGVWQSWDYLHNELGYAEHATRPTVFKSCADATWGEDAGNGYYDGDVSDMINGTFWTDADPTGWFDLDGLVWNSETYPADAAPSLLVKDGVASDALVITCDDGNYYLICAIIDTTAWIPESEVEALGWRSPSFVVVDSTTGKVVSGCNQELTTYELPSVVLNSENGYETYELPSVLLTVPKMVIGVPITGPAQAFWFTDNGQAETVDTELVIRNGLRDADGVKVKSVDSTDYQGANVLAYMEADGDMFTSSEASFTWFGSDSLRQLFVSNQDARGKSAWSVFAAKLFHLSFVNTQLPDVTIELPAAVVDTYGTSITLPTIDGEYESGGKTWKPSAWDIGAFGSSYSLTADTVAHLVFTEVVQYTEITVYANVSPTVNCQNNIVKGFTGDASSSNMVKLYTDENKTIPFKFDYSNNYEFGYYSSNTGEWVSAPIQSIDDMPASTADPGNGETVTKAYLLYDTGQLWFVCNNSNANYGYNNQHAGFYGSRKLRIYPKGQQHYVAYLQYNNIYSNSTASGSTNRSLYPYPYGGTSGNYKAWYNALPKPALTRLLKSAGNELPHQDGDTIITDNSWCLKYSHSVSQTFRLVEFTLDRPTLSAWLKADKTDLSVAQYTDYNLYDESGELITYDNTSAYVVLGLFKADKANCASEINMIQRCVLKGSSGQLVFSQDYSSSTFSRIWYVKYDDCKVAYFNANKSDYTLSVNARRALYDGSGNRIAFDGTKTYTFLQLRNASDVQNTVRFVNRGSMTFVDSGSGNLAFQNYSDTSYTVASVWYLEE